MSNRLPGRGRKGTLNVLIFLVLVPSVGKAWATEARGQIFFPDESEILRCERRHGEFFRWRMERGSECLTKNMSNTMSLHAMQIWGRDGS